MSKEYRGKRVVLWPVNIDSSASRGEGRKIPLRDAVRKPRVEEIVEAARRLGLNPVVEEARYPRKWWEQTKRIIVDKAGSKLETLRRIAAEVKRLREEKKLRHSD
ncbi:signal recognition particle subunit SRP19/SEC65 family protein [Pyrofollis japonicus]|uniref:signal recognition particle protein Srp19 n=1 Tax=Pyrofollis japonicus TaxID=3060460 RepID=UPI00295B6C66|nr:signal recognition particle protein Srp19 [Pyrofollis japonicus]BEP18235.1 signal recognition particle subunit SRP19/SEC65 family protein [Pyrofollis japonicus]